MTRLLALGLAGILATLAGNLAISWTYAKKPASTTEAQATLEVINLEPVSVPVIRDGKVEGYLVARVALSVDEADAKTNRPVLIIYANEAIFRALHEDEAFDFSALKPAQILPLAQRIATLANERIGRAVIKNAAIASLNYVRGADVRGQNGR
jgi:hypothetical protein